MIKYGTSRLHEQELFFFLSGKGTLVAGNKTVDLRAGIFVMVPANMGFTMTNTGTEQLTMYLVNEPVPQGFRPNKDMLVKDENIIPTHIEHWDMLVKPLWVTEDGLGTLENVLTVSFDPMTLGHPHFQGKGESFEEVWTAIYGETIVFIGKQIRMQPPGTGYLIPPNGNTPHANINTSGKPVKLFYFARYRDHEVRK